MVELAPTIPSEYKNEKDGKSKKDQEEVIRHHEATIQSLEIKVETLKSKLLEESSNFHHTILVRKISYNYCVIITFLFIFLLYYSF